MGNKTERSSNFELLRIVAMFMIIMYHITLHCVTAQIQGGNGDIKIHSMLFTQPLFYKKMFLVEIIMTFGQISNAVFLLISGYFMVKKGKELNLGGIAGKLLLQMGFAAVLLVVLSTVLFKIDGQNHYYTLLHINFFNQMSWYAGYYFFVMLIASLFLNEWLQKCGRRKYLTFLAATFAIVEFGWTGDLLGGVSGELRVAVTGIFLYALGGYIRMYDPFERVRSFVFCFIPVVLGGVILLSVYNSTYTNIENFYFSGDPGSAYTQNYTFYGAYSIVCVLIAVCMFVMFQRIRVPQSKVLNFLGKSTFMIYLAHDNPFVRSIWGTKDWAADLYYTPWLYCLDLLKTAAITFLAGVGVYVMYLGVGKIGRLLSWMFIKDKREMPAEKSSV